MSFTAPTYSDNCGGTLTRTSGYCNGCTYPLGDTSVGYVVSDAAGHTATCSFVVTVTDGQAPVIVCPADTRINTTADSCTSAIYRPDPVYIWDNCQYFIYRFSSYPQGNERYPPGRYLVGLSAVDDIFSMSGGNRAACSFNLTVVDQTAPILTCPSSQTIGTAPGQCQQQVMFGSISAVDNCQNVSYRHVSGGLNNTNFTVGSSTVSYAANDSSSNAATCSFSVMVQDTEAPSISKCDDGC